MCDSKRSECPRVRCSNPVTPPGECCPVCTTCDHKGQEYQDGETVTLPEDGCRKCKCQVTLRLPLSISLNKDAQTPQHIEFLSICAYNLMCYHYWHSYLWELLGHRGFTTPWPYHW